MLRVILQRSAFMALMLVGLLAITFTISHVAPGDPARLAAGPNATEAMVATIRAEYGLDQPLPVQYLRYVAGLLGGDLGQSIFLNLPVGRALLDRAEPT
ncbi:ABC transporter permease, partial [Mycobacterium tuberculosis]|nr:ABC transporter permease [Mycobacterium tuberculosis]